MTHYHCGGGNHFIVNNCSPPIPRKCPFNVEGGRGRQAGTENTLEHELLSDIEANQVAFLLAGLRL